MSTLTLPRQTPACQTLACQTLADRGMDGRLQLSATAAVDADLRRFGANRHVEVDDCRVGPKPGRPWVGGSADGLDATTESALRLLGGIAAASGWRNVPDGRVVHELLRGIPLTTACLHRAVGAEGAELLHQAGFVVAIGDRWRLAFAILSVNGAFLMAPHGIPVTTLREAVTETLVADQHLDALRAGARVSIRK